VIPLFLVRFAVRCLIAALYRVRVVGASNVPAQGASIGVQSSLMDGFLVGWAARHGMCGS
jgi:1-acyl-sn-glycerol-3-phosphate acyltransferase